jgi:simple sugar transport system substrate-binding protein
MKFTKFLATTAAATTLLALTACTGTGQQEQQPNNASGEKLDVAVITHAPPGDEFWDLVKSGAERAGSDLNVAVSYQGDSDPVKQSQLIDSAIAQQVDGIVLSMANPDGVRAAMASAKAANIPMALTFVGQDPVVAAKAAGERLVQAGVTKISCVIQVAGNVYLETTCSELAKIPGLSVTNLQVDGTNIADVQATIKSQLLADPSINGVFTINTDIGKAATEAVAETGSNAKVTAYNLNDDMVELIKSGKVLFTVDQQGFLQGYQAAQILHENVKYGNVLGGGQPVFTGPSFVTSENVDDVASFVSQGTR